MSQNTTEGRLIEAGNLPAFYVDGIASVEVNGETARVTYFVFRTCAGERVRETVLEVIWPAHSVGSGRMQHMVREARASGERLVLTECEGETAH